MQAGSPGKPPASIAKALLPLSPPGNGLKSLPALLSLAMLLCVPTSSNQLSGPSPPRTPPHSAARGPWEHPSPFPSLTAALDLLPSTLHRFHLPPPPPAHSPAPLPQARADRWSGGRAELQAWSKAKKWDIQEEGGSQLKHKASCSTWGKGPCRVLGMAKHPAWQQLKLSERRGSRLARRKVEGCSGPDSLPACFLHAPAGHRPPLGAARGPLLLQPKHLRRLPVSAAEARAHGTEVAATNRYHWHPAGPQGAGAAFGRLRRGERR